MSPVTNGRKVEVDKRGIKLTSKSAARLIRVWICKMELNISSYPYCDDNIHNGDDTVLPPLLM
jgi:hypothetical protein